MKLQTDSLLQTIAQICLVPPRKQLLMVFLNKILYNNLAFSTNFCSLMPINLWKRCATFLVTKSTFWTEKILLRKQKVAVLVNKPWLLYNGRVVLMKY